MQVKWFNSSQKELRNMKQCLKPSVFSLEKVNLMNKNNNLKIWQIELFYSQFVNLKS